MTREEARIKLIEIRAQFEVILSMYGLEISEVFDMAIKALEQELRDCKTCIHSDKGKCAGTEECHECMWESKYEQEPCEDCISRQQAIDKMQEMEDEDIEAYGCAIPEGFEGKRAIEALKTLPSIQPKPNTGHWIKSSNGMFAECSDCGKHGEYGLLKQYKYCPNCGAKMESEEA